jgi:hypothetical protein
MKMSDLRRVKENSSAAAVGVSSIGSTTGGLGQVADTVKNNKKKRKLHSGHVIIQRASEANG